MHKSTDSGDYQLLDQPLATMIKNFSNEAVIKEHSHPRHQLLFATTGIMQLRIGHEVWLVPGNRAVLIPAQVSHSILMLDKVQMCSTYIDANKSQAEIDKIKVVSVSPLMRELIIELGKSEIDYLPGSRSDQIAQLLENEIIYAGNQPIVIPLPSDFRLQFICNSILANPKDCNSLAYWGQELGASERTLSRLFKRKLGMSFREWKQKAKFHHALKLLGENSSVKQVAYLCGYNSPSAFTAAFHSTMGFVPSQLKLKIKSQLRVTSYETQDTRYKKV